MQAEITILSRAAAAVFAGRRQRRILMALIECERSLSELSSVSETPLNLLHHHMRRLLALGLVTVEREAPRAGRATKYYRASARSYFVPAELVTAALGRDMNLRLRDRLDHSLAASVAGFSYSVDDGVPKIRKVGGDGGTPPAAEMWLELRLSRTDAASLHDDLRTIVQKYAARATHSNPRYIVHAAIAEI